MNTFTNAVDVEQNKARTFNAGATNRSSLNACVDFFSIVGNRNQQFFREFELAYQQSPDVATRILLWARDIRGGSGERQTFRNLLGYLEDHHQTVLLKVLPKVPEVGRWDDLLIFKTDMVKKAAFTLIQKALAEGNALCAKWMPRQSVGKSGRARGRKGREEAVELRKFLELTPKGYRKLLASCTNVVETKMCANEWDKIDFEKIPSLAAARYQKAFNKHGFEKYEEYKEKLEKGEAKISAGAVYPYDVIKSINHGDQKVAIAQWNALPNYLGDHRILCVVDTSGSMGSFNYYGQRDWGFEVKGNVQPLDIAVSLGIYCAEKLKGAFHGMWCNFSTTPTLRKLSGNVVEMYNQLAQHGSDWHGSTDIEKAMAKILDVATRNKVPANEMPEMLLIISDMEFNYCVNGEETVYEATARRFAEAGYELPKIVFWNVNSRSGNYPVTANERGTGLISGFSPAIMKAVLSIEDMAEFTPEAIMLKTVMVPRYAVEGIAEAA